MAILKKDYLVNALSEKTDLTKKAAKEIRRSRYIITRSAMLGFRVDGKHYFFVEGKNGK